MPFSITCAACQKTFSIADDVYERKVKGRVVTIKCKQCHAGIRVDGTKETPAFSLSESVRPPAVAASPAAKKEQASAPGFAKPLEASKPAAGKPALAATGAAPVAKAAPAPATPKSAPNQGGRPQPFGVKPPPAAPAVQGGPVPVAAPKAPVVAATPKAPPVGVRPPPAAPALKSAPIAAPAPAEPVPPPAETLWAVDYPDGEDRELTLLQIQQALASGAIDPTALVWREGMAEWLELGQVAELQSLVTKPAAPVQRPKAASAPELAPQRPKAASAPDLPLQRPKAASAPDLPRPKAASAPDLPLQRPRAASALAFELPESPAVARAPAQAPKPSEPESDVVGAPKPAPARPSFPPVNSPPGAAKPLGPSSALQPVVAAKPTPPAGALRSAGLDEYPTKSKTPLIIGALLLLALAAGAIFFLTRSSDELPPPAPISALPAEAPTTVHSAPPEPALTQDTAAVERPRALPGSNAALEPPSSGPQTPPNAGFAEMFANGARSADEKHRATGALQRFDPAAAKIALANAASSASACREKTGPSGKASVVVTFEPSGNVSTATVSDAPFAGTSSGSCIAETFKKATVPPFSGPPGTVTKIINVP